jgi:hypothetical protein
MLSYHSKGHKKTGHADDLRIRSQRRSNDCSEIDPFNSAQSNCRLFLPVTNQPLGERLRPPETALSVTGISG